MLNQQHCADITQSVLARQELPATSQQQQHHQRKVLKIRPIAPLCE